MFMLNKAQREAVENIEGPTMVLAGPGTGKTQIIASRIAEILQRTDMQAYNILCLTFTESGVLSMKERLFSKIGVLAYKVQIHTFHSFCNEVILDNKEKFMFAAEMNVINEVENVQILKEILSQDYASALRPFGNPDSHLRAINSCFQSLKRERCAPKDFLKRIEEIEKDIERVRPEAERVFDINGRKLSYEDLAGLRSLMAGTIFEQSFAGLDEADGKERTAVKNKAKKHFLKILQNMDKYKAFAAIYSAYQDTLRLKGLYDFDDMIIFVADAFAADEDLLASYREQFQYILVDEYQDTNGAQNEVLHLLADYFDAPNVFVVGDDKQSIYRFQGASLENILSFSRRYAGQIFTISLEENYRSQQNILDAAKSLISHNAPTGDLIARAGHEIKPLRLAACSSWGLENHFLASEVSRLISENCPPDQIAILFRENKDVADLKDLFLRLDIPFQVEFGQNILDDPKIMQLLRLLELVHNLNNDTNLFRVLHFKFLNFDALDVARLSHSKPRNTSFFEHALSQEKTAEFLKICADWRRTFFEGIFLEALERVVKESGFFEYIMSGENKLEDLNRLNTLFDVFKNLNKKKKDLSLAEALEYVSIREKHALPIWSHGIKTKNRGVRLMTAHKSKGLEFEHVYIMKCVDKHWGNKRAKSGFDLPPGLLNKESNISEANEEERRLFYVAMTRAKKTLTLTYSKSDSADKLRSSSMFVHEIDPIYIENLDMSQFEENMEKLLTDAFLPIIKKNVLEKEKAFAQSLLDNYVMSVTHLNNYLECPRKFYYQNLLRAPSVKNKHAALGTAVHKALNILARSLMEGAKASKELTLQAFEKALEKELLSDREHKETLLKGRQDLEKYFDRYLEEMHPNILSEYSFRSHGVTIEGVPVTGDIDKIEILQDSAGKVGLVDYKTGNPANAFSKLKKGEPYHRQIVFYHLLCEYSDKFKNEVAWGEIDFIEADKKTSLHKKVRIYVDEEDKINLKNEIRQTYDDIKSLKFLDMDELSLCGECIYCQENWWAVQDSNL